MERLSQFLAFLSLLAVCLSDAHNITTSKCGGKEKASTLLDVSRDFINKAKNLYPDCIDDASNCGQKEKSLAFLDLALNLISQVENDYPNCSDREPERPEDLERHLDCGEILRSGKKQSGVYTIWPKSRISPNKSLSVYCDMDTDGGGWTVIQRRGHFSTPKDYFYKDWADYKEGFGNIKEEFWIGNDNIHAITNQAKYSLRVDLKHAVGDIGYSNYSTFRIEDEAADYTLHIDGYSGGNAGDGMQENNNMKFSTKDRKNDIHSSSCAVARKGAWWYSDCSYVNPNGLYQPGTDSKEGCAWYTFKNTWRGISWIEMKLR